ncbi:hypothetical protein V8B97DRAFT_1919028 [Scleroderma yunnanense]
MKAYIGINNMCYHMDNLKISFALLFMMEGSVWSFKDSYIDMNWINSYGFYTTDSFVDFEKSLCVVFQVGDIKAMTLIHLLDIKQGNQPLDAYITTFLNGMRCASLKDTNMAVETFFAKGLSPRLCWKILDSSNGMPSRVSDWVVGAIKARASNAMFSIFNGRALEADKNFLWKEEGYQPKKQEHDPYAMDIN